MDIFRLPDPPAVIEPITFSSRPESDGPIVIDNGSTNFRYGWASQEGPFVSPSLVSKYRDKRTNLPILLFGDAVDVDIQTRAAAKSPWEGDHLNNSEALEAALDFAFLHLGVQGPNFGHPLIMTERLCGLSSSRAMTSELLFELYSVPGVTYAIDGLMSFAYNQPKVIHHEDGLVLSFNTASTSVIPLLNGQPVWSGVKRLPFGGQQASQYAVKLMQLKYPNFPAPTLLNTPQAAAFLFQKFSEFSSDYEETLRHLSVPEHLSEANRVVQFPFSQTTEKIKTEEELAALAERRKESGRRLQEDAMRRRTEKLLQKEQDLEELLAIRDWKGKEDEESYMMRLEDAGMEKEKELHDTIKKLEADLKKAKKKDIGEEDLPEEPTFPLVDIPDEQLDEEGLKEKRRQKLLKGLYDARIRSKEEKAKEKAAAEEDARLEAIERQNDFDGWASRLRSEQERIMNRLRERGKRKTELADRKSAASQNRMRNIATLTADQAPARKRRKRGEDDDDFGMDDADFDIYREIGGGDNLSEEEDLSQLKTIEQNLLTNDPSFSITNTYAALSTRKSALIQAFCPAYDPSQDQDTVAKYQVAVNIERWKVPEAWFSPSMAGVDCAGLGEIIGGVLGGLSLESRVSIAKNVFITGGPAQIPNLPSRILSTIQPLLPPHTTINVKAASHLQLDAWKGMAAFARTDEFGRPGYGRITREDYDEYGADRIRTWWGGNPNYTI